MSKTEKQRDDNGHGNDDKKGKPDNTVTITIDDKSVQIERGSYTVEQIKEFGKVDLAYNLLKEVNGKLVPIPDNASVGIQGGEIFHSRVKSGGSS